MKKWLLYLPALVHTAATVCLNIISGALIPLWHIWNIFFWLSGFLMGRGKGWGCVFGLLPAVMVLGMRWRQPGIECLVGAVWLAFYLACGTSVKRRKGSPKC